MLFVASEAYTFIKTGGVGNMVYALPKALRKLEIDIRVIIPKYSGIPLPLKNCMETNPYCLRKPSYAFFNEHYHTNSKLCPNIF